MKPQTLIFPSGVTTHYYFQANSMDLRKLAEPEGTIIITDEQVAELYKEQLRDYRVLRMETGESHKTLDTIARLGEELIHLGAVRGTRLLGLGGGVVTDVCGFLASTFMRGLPFAFVPTTLLAQVDAAIGGKNGVNLGLHKNMLGTIRQPEFILFDHQYLNSLPTAQWSNGFAEIIKYGFIADTRILTTLQSADIDFFQKHPEQLNALIEGCVDVKNKIVHADETENGIRKLLNFGHTAGHALETLYGLPHGNAVGLGMRVAVRLSEEHCGLKEDASPVLLELLNRYQLPTHLSQDAEQILTLLLTDKKRHENGVDYVLLEKPGVAITKNLGREDIMPALEIIRE